MFGEFIKQQRLKAGFGLREFCKQYKHDPSNWSKIERGIIPAPKDEEKLKEWALQLKITPNTAGWHTFIDLAFAERGRIPSDIMKNATLVEELPKFFRTLRGQKPTEEEMKNLIDIIKRS